MRTQTPNTGRLPIASTLAAWQSHKVTWSKAQQLRPNPYEDSICQETNSSPERFFGNTAKVTLCL